MPNLSHKVIDVLRIESDCHGSTEATEQRRRAIEHNPSTVRRLGAQGLHAAAGIIGRERLFRLFARPYEKEGYTVLGHGAQSTALRSGQQVIKLIRSSSRMSPAERARFATDTDQMIEINRTTHPDFCLPTQVSVTTIRHLGEVVALLQRFTPRVDPVELSSGLQRQIVDFAEASLDTMVPNGFAPDVLGRNNVYFNSEEQLTLVDTVPVDHETFGKRFYDHVTALRNMAYYKKLPDS